MSRISNDQYRMIRTGVLVSSLPSGKPPAGSVLWNGYDYENQYWVHEGKRDMRTLEELRIASGS